MDFVLLKGGKAMKIVKKINNNVAIGVDKNNNELIVFGTGVGFPKVPYELTDLSKIQRTYYGVSNYYINLVNEIPERIFELSTKIIDYARKHVENDFSPNIVFTLADHIQFVVERSENNLDIKMPFSYDIQYLYEEEMRVGLYAVKLLSQELNTHLSKDEAYSIALHFINAENMLRNQQGSVADEKVIADITEIVEDNLNVSIDKEGFNYSRFVTHLQYLLKRTTKNMEIASDNKMMYESMKVNFPDIYKVVEKIRGYIDENLHWHLSDEECLYLILHINRLCSREDCYQ